MTCTNGYLYQYKLTCTDSKSSCALRHAKAEFALTHKSCVHTHKTSVGRANTGSVASLLGPWDAIRCGFAEYQNIKKVLILSFSLEIRTSLLGSLGITFNSNEIK